MNDNLEKKMCNSVYAPRCHIINTLTYNCFYLEFLYKDENLNLFQMLLSLKENRDKHYGYSYFSCQEFIDKYKNIKPKISTKQDIKDLHLVINNLLRHLEDAVSLNPKHRGKKELYPNKDVQGYYVNHEYRGDKVPESLLEKIYSADRYKTLINEKSEILIIMEKAKTISVFYVLDTQ